MIMWFTAFLDLPSGRFDEGARFWTEVTGWPLSERRGERRGFATLLPSSGDPHLELQAVDGPAASHLDVHVTDRAAGVAAAQALGAQVRAERDGYVIMDPPGGFVFCVVPTGSRGVVPPPATWSGGRSSVEQLCLDIPDDAPQTTAHLDLASDDREAEVHRHEALGAEVGYVGRGWTTMADPVGSTYCVTDRVPAYDLPPSRPS